MSRFPFLDYNISFRIKVRLFRRIINCDQLWRIERKTNVQGPYDIGSIGAQVGPSEWDWEKRHLVRGERYRVIKQFVDADGSEHPIGEEWQFLGSTFSKFDDELILWVRLQSGDWKIPLVWNKGKQQTVIENWQEYVTRS